MHEHERKLLTAMRRALVASIRRRLRPLVRPCGYAGVKMVARKPGSKSGGARTFGFVRAFDFGSAKSEALRAFDGFTLDGVLDGNGFGCVIQPWSSIAVEDLIMLDAFLARAVEKGQLK